MDNSAETQDILTRYSWCMNEIKSRTDVIHRFLKRKVTTGYGLTDTETVALQFRKIFELIALASLVAHKDEYAKQRKSFATDWHATKIIEVIEKINPKFYPIPTKQVHDEKGTPKGTIDIDEGFLTKEEYLEAFNKCSDMLHADNPFSPSKDALSIYKQFPEWLKKMQTLLNHHQVQLYDSNYQIWCIMKGKFVDKKMDGQVQVMLMKRVD